MSVQLDVSEAALLYGSNIDTTWATVVSIFGQQNILKC